ncbi:hypothetical protein CEP51_003763 [Fusarium floridanum]|uniref:Transcription factor domain-containing protein n=1 Tax=Fusarium floridanum TaxID=1325733 RepID=A0A428S4C9_9HYPO|nr:hypothetical protein CEP51_003763 [Fusarium floridanum]
MMHAELDQLYFDRVHPSIPILHQRRYLSWSKNTPKTTSRICLQHAMWALASLLSTQFTHLTEPLYQTAKQTTRPSMGADCHLRVDAYIPSTGMDECRLFLSLSSSLSLP